MASRSNNTSNNSNTTTTGLARHSLCHHLGARGNLQNSIVVSPPPPTSSTGPYTPPTPRCQFSPRSARSAGEEQQSTSTLLPFCRLLSSGFQSDLTITFSDGSPELRVHRMVLAMQSPVLECLVSDKWARDSIEMPEDSPAATRWLMHHMYCGLRQLPDCNIALQVLEMANKYCLPSATGLATELLVNHVNDETFAGIFDAAVLSSNQRLLQQCEKHLEEHTDEVLAGDNFPMLSRVAVRHLLITASLKPSSELRVFTSLIKWAQHKVLSAKKKLPGPITSSQPPPPPPPPSPSSPSQAPESRSPPPVSFHMQLRLEVVEFLSRVRFLTMTTTEVIKEVLGHGVLSAQEGVSLLRHMEGCPGANLPYIASCKIRTPRNLKSEESEAKRAKGRDVARRGLKRSAGVQVSGSGRGGEHLSIGRYRNSFTSYSQRGHL